jgi:hypothetical protein
MLCAICPTRYFDEGADEVAFLNITGFRECPLEDLPMLGVLQVGGCWDTYGGREEGGVTKGLGLLV